MIIIIESASTRGLVSIRFTTQSRDESLLFENRNHWHLTYKSQLELSLIDNFDWKEYIHYFYCSYFKELIKRYEILMIKHKSKFMRDSIFTNELYICILKPLFGISKQLYTNVDALNK